MGEQWKEEHLLNLVDAVRKVEDKRRSHERIWRNSKARVVCEDEKWDQVASEIPFSVFMEMSNRSPGWYEDFAVVCKRKFCEICEYFNNVFVKSERNNCLTRTLMTKLADYSEGFPEQSYFFKTGPQARFIKTDRETEWLAPSASATVAESSTGFSDQQPHQASNILPRRKCIQPNRGTVSLAHPASSPTTESFGGPPEEPRLSKTGPRAKHIKTDRESTESPIHLGRTIAIDWSSTVRGCSREASHHSSPFKEQLDSPASSKSDQQESSQQTESETRSSWEQCSQDDLEENNSKFKTAEFVKRMTFSSVKRGFLLRLPADFCNTNFALFHLEKRVPIVLVDEHLAMWKVQYIPDKQCISAGWGTFAKHHRLQVDDIVRFRLINCQTFQVTKIKGAQAGEFKTD